MDGICLCVWLRVADRGEITPYCTFDEPKCCRTYHLAFPHIVLHSPLLILTRQHMTIQFFAQTHQYDSHDGMAINASSVTDFYYTAMRAPVVFDLSTEDQTSDPHSTAPH